MESLRAALERIATLNRHPGFAYASEAALLHEVQKIARDALPGVPQENGAVRCSHPDVRSVNYATASAVECGRCGAEFVEVDTFSRMLDALGQRKEHPVRESKKREHYWDGFRDALVHGARNIGMGMQDSARVAYQRGYDDGQRAEKRIASCSSRDQTGTKNA